MKEEGVVGRLERLLKCLGSEVEMRELYPRMREVEFWDLEGEVEVGEEVRVMGAEVRRRFGLEGGGSTRRRGWRSGTRRV